MKIKRSLLAVLTVATFGLAWAQSYSTPTAGQDVKQSNEQSSGEVAPIRETVYEPARLLGNRSKAQQSDSVQTALPPPTCANGASDYPTCTPPTCANGASDYPTCTPPPPVCANGASNYPTCTFPPPVCANGATNYPICTFTCANGASDYPTCTPPPVCANGATNYPICTFTCANGASDYPTCTPPTVCGPLPPNTGPVAGSCPAGYTGVAAYITYSSAAFPTCSVANNVPSTCTPPPPGCTGSVPADTGPVPGSCGPGYTGVAAYVVYSTFPYPMCHVGTNIGSSCVPIVNTCANGATNFPTCTIVTTSTETGSMPCAAPQIGTIYGARTVTVTNGVAAYGEWYETSNSCTTPTPTCVPTQQAPVHTQGWGICNKSYDIYTTYGTSCPGNVPYTSVQMIGYENALIYDCDGTGG